MIVGSHNSWSYLPSKKWWMAPFKFMAKCQDLNIIEQYEIGVRCFDLRVRFNKKGEFILGHGFMQYDIIPELQPRSRTLVTPGMARIRSATDSSSAGSVSKIV